MQQIELSYDDQQTQELSKDITQAWKALIYHGQSHLGSKILRVTRDYREWLRSRINRCNLRFDDPSPMMGEDVCEVNCLLTKQINDKEEEIARMIQKDAKNARVIKQLQDECAILHGQITQNNGKKLKEMKLKSISY